MTGRWWLEVPRVAWDQVRDWVGRCLPGGGARHQIREGQARLALHPREVHSGHAQLTVSFDLDHLARHCETHR